MNAYGLQKKADPPVSTVKAKIFLQKHYSRNNKVSIFLRKLIFTVPML